METDRIIIGGLLVIILIVTINAAMYGIVRGMTRRGNSNWLNTIRKSLDKPLEGSAGKSMDELRKKIEELEENKNKEEK